VRTAPSVDRPPRPSRLPGLTTQIFLGLAIGIVIGWIWPAMGVGIKPLADAFLRMIRMIIAPLLFSTLVVGIAGTGDVRAMGRIGLKAIIYFEIATTIALFLGLALVNVFRPGAGLTVPLADTAEVAAMTARQQRAATSCRLSSLRAFSASRWRPSARTESPCSICSRASRRPCSR
jgi:proton glutamate symport protein